MESLQTLVKQNVSLRDVSACFIPEFILEDVAARKIQAAFKHSLLRWFNSGAKMDPIKVPQDMLKKCYYEIIDYGPSLLSDEIIENIELSVFVFGNSHRIGYRHKITTTKRELFGHTWGSSVFTKTLLSIPELKHQYLKIKLCIKLS